MSQRLHEVSNNGYVWSAVDFPFDSPGRDYVYDMPGDIMYDGRNYIAASNGNLIASSSDFTKWDVIIENSAGTGSSLGMDTNGRKDVIVGDKLYIASADAGSDSWMERDSPATIRDVESVPDYYTICLCDVAANEKTFVAVGARGLVLCSTDGNMWELSQTNVRFWLREVV